MKTIKFLSIIAASILIIQACTKDSKLLDENNKWVYADTAANGYVKFVHAFPSLTPALTTGAGPSVQIYMEGTRITGSTTTYNGTQPVPTGVYATVPAGGHTFYYIMNRVTGGVFSPVAGDTVFRNTANVAAGKYYSMFMTDTVPTPSVLVVNDNFSVPAIGQYMIRYGNLVVNPADRYDVYSVRSGANIFTNVGYKEFSNFISLPASTLADTFVVRKTGTMTLIDSVKAFSPTSQRVYTLYSRGKTGIAGRTPATTFYTNR